MPDVESRLGLRAASLSDAANAFAAVDDLRDDVQDYLERLLDMRNDALVEGVVGVGDGLVTRLNANTARVAAGAAWVDADGVVIAGRNAAAGYARSGLYRVSWPQTDITIPNTASNKRVDRIIVPVGLHGTSVTPTRVAGGTQSIVDHDSLQLAGALPSGALQLATVIAATTGISATNDLSNGIMDRRWRSDGTRVIDFTTAPFLVGGLEGIAHGGYEFELMAVGATDANVSSRRANLLPNGAVTNLAMQNWTALILNGSGTDSAGTLEGYAATNGLSLGMVDNLNAQQFRLDSTARMLIRSGMRKAWRGQSMCHGDASNRTFHHMAGGGWNDTATDLRYAQVTFDLCASVQGRLVVRRVVR